MEDIIQLYKILLQLCQGGNIMLEKEEVKMLEKQLSDYRELIGERFEELNDNDIKLLKRFFAIREKAGECGYWDIEFECQDVWKIISEKKIEMTATEEPFSDEELDEYLTKFEKNNFGYFGYYDPNAIEDNSPPAF